VPVTLSLAPFPAEPGKAFVAVIVNLDSRTGGAGGDTTKKRRAHADVQVAAYPGPGEREKAVATDKQSFSTILAAGESTYDVFTRLTVPPGHYVVNVTVKVEDQRSGTAIEELDVPDFAHNRLTATGVLVRAIPAPPAGPETAYDGLLPWTPTGSRMFASRDRLSVWLRICEGGSEALEPVRVRAQLRTETGRNVATNLARMDRSAFEAGRSAPYLFEVPLERLPPGQYVLAIDLSAGGASVTREVHFGVH
jgi:hypothetical protein